MCPLRGPLSVPQHELASGTVTQTPACLLARAGRSSRGFWQAGVGRGPGLAETQPHLPGTGSLPGTWWGLWSGTAICHGCHRGQSWVWAASAPLRCPFGHLRVVPSLLPTAH